MSTGLLIEINSDRENLGGSIQNDEWSRDSTRTINSLTKVAALDAKDSLAYALKNGDFPECDLVVGAEVGPGDQVYIVWVEYTTGDSFGTDYGQVELIAAFVDEAKAKKCASDCEHFQENQAETYLNASRYSLKVELDNGQAYEVHVPWTGYFESLERAHVTPKTITTK